MNTVPSLKTPWRIAHRGEHARHVENTLDAFATAYDLGCDMVEFDVQLSSDGIPIIFHDDDLRRLAGKPDPVFTSTAAQLQSLTLRDPKTGATGRVPTLAEFLAAFGTRPYYLEIKIPAAREKVPEYWQALTEKIVAALSQVRGHAATFLASFHPDAVCYALQNLGVLRVAAIHENFETWRAALSAPAADPFSRRLFDSVAFPVFQAAMAAKLPLQVDRVLLWQVDGDAEFDAACSAGVAGIVADDIPGMLRRCARSA